MTISAGRVTRVDVAAAGGPSDPEHADTDSELWSVEYPSSGRRLELPGVGPVLDLTSNDPAVVQAPTIARCEVPL